MTLRDTKAKKVLDIHSRKWLTMACHIYRYTCPEAGLGLRNSQKKQQTLEVQLPRLRDSMHRLCEIGKKSWHHVAQDPPPLTPLGVLACCLGVLSWRAVLACTEYTGTIKSNLTWHCSSMYQHCSLRLGSKEPKVYPEPAHPDLEESRKSMGSERLVVLSSMLCLLCSVSTAQGLSS